MTFKNLRKRYDTINQGNTERNWLLSLGYAVGVFSMLAAGFLVFLAVFIIVGILCQVE